MGKQLPPPQTTLLILLGASQWPNDSKEFKLNKAFKQAAEEIEKYFTNSFGIPNENVLSLFDSDLDAIEIGKEIRQYLTKFEGNAKDVIVYYVGHAKRTRKNNQLYLAIKDTQQHDPEGTSLKIESLAKAVRAPIRGIRRFYIFDCCFSASAISDLQGPKETDLLQDALREEEEEEENETRGFTALFSSGMSETSVILPDDTNTYFTAALLQVLSAGSISSNRLLSFSNVCDKINSCLKALYTHYHSTDPTTPKPPYAQIYLGAIAKFPLFPNPGFQKDVHHLAPPETKRLMAADSPAPAAPTKLLQAALPVSSIEPQPSQPLPRQKITKYEVALSYAGEDRKYAEALAQALRRRNLTVFYDQYEKSDLWGKNLYTYLSDIYQNRAHYCVIFLSQHYASKQWTKHEREAAQARAFRENEEYILPVRLDDTKIPAIPETVAYLNWPPETAETIADALMEKLQRQPRETLAASGMGKRRISRRTAIWFGLAGLATITVAGGEIAVLLQSHPSMPLQPPQNSTEGPPNSAINSSGSTFGFDPQHTRFNPYEHILSSTNASRLVLYWTASTGGDIHSSPAVANGVVYIGSDKLYAFNAATGKTLWTAITGAAIVSSPAVANGVAYIGSDDHKLYAFNATTGKLLWTAFTSERVTSSPAVMGGVVYVGSLNYDFYAFNATTGKLLWTAFADPGYWIFSSPAVANGVVYVGSYDHKLYAFNAATGKMLWTAPTGAAIFSSPAVANRVVYVGSDDYKLYAFNAATGKSLWTASTGATVESSPAVANGVIYVGSFDHKLHAFNAATGKTLWTASTNAAIESSPTVANGVVYMGSRDYSLYAFNAATGKTLWTASTGGEINSSPAVADGVVYVGSYDNKLYAFHLPRNG